MKLEWKMMMKKSSEKLIHFQFDHCQCFDKTLNENFTTIKLITNKKMITHLPAGIYLLKVNNRSTRARCEICSKLTIKIPERRHWRRFGIFTVNFEHISPLVLVFLL